MYGDFDRFPNGTRSRNYNTTRSRTNYWNSTRHSDGRTAQSFPFGSGERDLFSSSYSYSPDYGNVLSSNGTDTSMPLESSWCGTQSRYWQDKKSSAGQRSMEDRVFGTTPTRSLLAEPSTNDIGYEPGMNGTSFFGGKKLSCRNDRGLVGNQLLGNVSRYDYLGLGRSTEPCGMGEDSAACSRILFGSNSLNSRNLTEPRFCFNPGGSMRKSFGGLGLGRNAAGSTHNISLFSDWRKEPTESCRSQIANNPKSSNVRTARVQFNADLEDGEMEDESTSEWEYVPDDDDDKDDASSSELSASRTRNWAHYWPRDTTKE
eukprot:GHVQ01037959.1.p1 GENE.GHVQ01037959.1~~GHVQ01037959.1.p1  ORF type:complete len:317 (+),score=29.42 GHVQ01037959.1:204-1154(+)